MIVRLFIQVHLAGLMMSMVSRLVLCIVQGFPNSMWLLVLLMPSCLFSFEEWNLFIAGRICSFLKVFLLDLLIDNLGLVEQK